jgi:hypothetical protein
MPRSFVPTDEQRQKVKLMAGFGLKHEQIAILIGIGSAATLRKHFGKELTLGPIEAQANVRKTLFKLATSGRNPGATMYWLKTRARWSEKGKTPEPVEERAQTPIWRISVYQPPRTPEQEQELQDALSGFHGSSGEWEEWEDAPGEPHGISRASPPG